MNSPALRFPSGAPRLSPGCCPACGNASLESAGIIPYPLTLAKWGIDPRRCREVLHWEPEEYKFAVERCRRCGTWSVPQGNPELVQHIETCAEFYQHHDREYFRNAQPPMDESLARTIVRSRPEELDAWHRHFQQAYTMVRKILSRRGGRQRFLDLGSSYGSVARFLELAIPELEVWACELNPISRLRTSERYPDLRLLGARIENISTETPFDIVYCSNVVEHVWELDGFLRSLRRILAPEGMALLLTPDGECAEIGRQGLGWWGFIVPHHCQLLTRRGLMIALERNGFDVDSSGVDIEQEFWMLAGRSAMEGI